MSEYAIIGKLETTLATTNGAVKLVLNPPLARMMDVRFGADARTWDALAIMPDGSARVCEVQAETIAEAEAAAIAALNIELAP